MNVYIVFYGYDYEGEDIYAVFDSADKAKNFILNATEGMDTEFSKGVTSGTGTWRIFYTYDKKHRQSSAYYRIDMEVVK